MAQTCFDNGRYSTLPFSITSHSFLYCYSHSVVTFYRTEFNESRERRLSHSISCSYIFCLLERSFFSASENPSYMSVYKGCSRLSKRLVRQERETYNEGGHRLEKKSGQAYRFIGNPPRGCQKSRQSTIPFWQSERHIQLVTVNFLAIKNSIFGNYMQYLPF